MIKGFYPYQKFYKNISNTFDGVVHTTRTQIRDAEKEERFHLALLSSGFEYNPEYDFYFSDEGALMSDAGTSIEELTKYPWYKDCLEEGYEMVYGNPIPVLSGVKTGKAIYCKNYREILARYKQITEQNNLGQNSENQDINPYSIGYDKDGNPMIVDNPKLRS